MQICLLRKAPQKGPLKNISPGAYFRHFMVFHHNPLTTYFDAFQHIQFKLAEMATALITSRLIVRQAAHALDSKSPDASTLCSMAKLSATDQCFEVCLVQNGHSEPFEIRKFSF